MTTRRRASFFNQAAGGGGGATSGGTITIGPEHGAGTQQMTLTIGTVTANAVMTDYLAGKDTWNDTIALCPVDTNHNASDLQLEGIAATRKDVYVSFDLSALPTGVTFSSASLTLYCKTAPTVNEDVTLNHIANADEAYDEATLRCSTAPTLTPFQTWTAPFASTGDKTIALNSTALTRLAARMGVGYYTIVLTGAATLTNTVLQSKDSGGTPGNSSGPRLSSAYSKTL